MSSIGKSIVFNDIFIAQPNSIKEELAGKLFVLIEISGSNGKKIKIINFLVDKLNKNYYQSEKIILREKIKTLKVEHIFEAALAKTNKDFSIFLENENLKKPIINITAGIIYKNNIHFTNSGKNKIFLIYKVNKTKSDEYYNKEDYKITDIAKEPIIKNKNTTKQNTKLFNDVISGDIPNNGNFIITNEALPEYISKKQLIKIITTLPPTSSAEQIKNILKKINSYIPFAGLIIKSSQNLKENKQQSKTLISAQESILDLNKTEEKTYGLLTSSGVFDLKKYFNFKKNKNAIILKDKMYIKKRTLFSLKKITLILKKIILDIWQIIFKTIKSMSNKEKIVNFFKNFKQKINNSLKFIINLRIKNKILLSLFLIFIIFFIINILLNKKENNIIEQEKKYNEIFEIIKQKQNKAESNLLYNNKKGAQKFFKEIEDLMLQLPQTTNEQKKEFNELKQKIELEMEKTRKITRINNPFKLADFSDLNTNANPKNIIMDQNSKNIYIADQNKKSIYIFNIESKETISATNIEIDINMLKYPTIISNKIFYYNNGSIVEINSNDNNINENKLAITQNPENYVSISSYIRYLYLLDSKNNEILKFNKTNSGFSPPASWLNENINLSNAVDMDIDGSIYILKNNGEVIKLLNGKKIKFELEKIDLPLKKTEKIQVSDELEYIYILERQASRLVVFKKTGKFVMQYKIDKLKNIKDFIVDEKNKIVYLLDNSILYNTKALHLK